MSSSRASGESWGRKYGHVHIAVGAQRASGGGAKHKGQLNFCMLGKCTGYLLCYGCRHVRILLP